MGIKIGSELAGYYASVGGLLTTINKNRVGAVLITRLEQHKKIVSIYPMDKGMAARYGDDNAATRPRNAEGSAPAGVSRAPADPKTPYWYRGDGDIPATREDERYDMVPK